MCLCLCSLKSPNILLGRWDPLPSTLCRMLLSCCLTCSHHHACLCILRQLAGTLHMGCRLLLKRHDMNLTLQSTHTQRHVALPPAQTIKARVLCRDYLAKIADVGIARVLTETHMNSLTSTGTFAWVRLASVASTICGVQPLVDCSLFGLLCSCSQGPLHVSQLLRQSPWATQHRFAHCSNMSSRQPHPGCWQRQSRL